jgi:monoamine oxidase
MTGDVAVIGGGMAGLAAADRLARAGCKVVLLEARARLGGRIHTVVDPATDHAVELGAEFLEGQPRPLLQLIESAGITLQEIPERHERADQGSRRHFPDVEALVDRLLANIPDGEDIPVAQLLRQRARDFSSQELDAITGYLEGFHAADLERFGTAALAENQAAEAQDAEHLFRLEGGYGRVVSHLASTLKVSGAEVRTETVAQRLNWKAGAVELEAQSRAGGATRIIAAQAVVAVPLSILKAARNAEGGLFPAPSPPGWSAALACLEVGPAQHMVLRFDDAWWVKQQRSPPVFMHGMGEDFPVWWTSTPPDLPFLTGWAGGPGASKLAGQTLEQLVPLALQSASSIFGIPVQRLASKLRAAYSHDWSSDPYTRGGYSYGGVGALPAREVLRRPVSQTLFLAGEALAEEGRNGTVPGALASGLRAVEAALQTELAQD